MILLFNEFIKEARVQNKNVFLFTTDERDLFEDLLQEYIDKYSMIEMPLDVDNYRYFDYESNKIQYLVQRLRNISIDIEVRSHISIDELFEDIKTNLVPKIKRHGYMVYHCDIEHGSTRNCISLTIMKDD